MGDFEIYIKKATIHGTIERVFDCTLSHCFFFYPLCLRPNFMDLSLDMLLVHGATSIEMTRVNQVITSTTKLVVSKDA